MVNYYPTHGVEVRFNIFLIEAVFGIVCLITNTLVVQVIFRDSKDKYFFHFQLDYHNMVAIT